MSPSWQDLTVNSIQHCIESMLHDLTALQPVEDRRSLLALLLPPALRCLRPLRSLRRRRLLPLHRRGLNALNAAIQTQVDVLVQLRVGRFWTQGALADRTQRAGVGRTRVRVESFSWDAWR